MLVTVAEMLGQCLSSVGSMTRRCRRLPVVHLVLVNGLCMGVLKWWGWHRSCRSFLKVVGKTWENLSEWHRPCVRFVGGSGDQGARYKRGQSPRRMSWWRWRWGTARPAGRHRYHGKMRGVWSVVLVKGFVAWFGPLVGQLAGMLSPSRCAVPIFGTWRSSWTYVHLCSCRPSGCPLGWWLTNVGGGGGGP